MLLFTADTAELSEELPDELDDSVHPVSIAATRTTREHQRKRFITNQPLMRKFAFILHSPDTIPLFHRFDQYNSTTGEGYA